MHMTYINSTQEIATSYVSLLQKLQNIRAVLELTAHILLTLFHVTYAFATILLNLDLLSSDILKINGIILGGIQCGTYSLCNRIFVFTFL